MHEGSFHQVLTSIFSLWSRFPVSVTAGFAAGDCDYLASIVVSGDFHNRKPYLTTYIFWKSGSGLRFPTSEMLAVMSQNQIACLFFSRCLTAILVWDLLNPWLFSPQQESLDRLVPCLEAANLSLFRLSRYYSQVQWREWCMVCYESESAFHLFHI